MSHKKFQNDLFENSVTFFQCKLHSKLLTSLTNQKLFQLLQVWVLPRCAKAFATLGV